MFCLSCLLFCFGGEKLSLFVYSGGVGGSPVLATDEFGDLVHQPLFSSVGGFLCLTCQILHVGSLVCPRPLHSLVGLSVLLFVPLLQSL